MSANNIRLYLTGKKPQPYDPSNNSITINAAGNNIQANRANSCFITPIRNATFSDALYYDPSSGEITFDASGGVISGDASGVEYWAFDSSNNFYGPSGNTLTVAVSNNTQIAMGDGALNNGSGGNKNVGIGYDAGKNTGAVVVVVIGARAGSTDGVGANDTIVGADAYRYAGLNAGVVGAGNTAGGYAAMRGTDGTDTSPGDYHTAIGCEAMFRVGEGDTTAVDEKSVAVGAEALVRGGVRNVGLGYRALYYNAAVGDSTRPYCNVAVGARCMGAPNDSVSTDISFNNNVAVGYESLWRSTVWDGAAKSNIAIGYRASYDITPTDISHTIVINATGEALNPQDSSRCYIKPISAGSGDDILYYDPSWGEITYGTDSSKDVNWWEFDAQNNFYGPDTDKTFDSGAYRNVACGVGALAEILAGGDNVGIGYNAYNLDTGLRGCAVGYEAAATASSVRVAIGSKAMAKAPYTIYAVPIGYRALEDPGTSSSWNTTAIGYEADASGGLGAGDDQYCVYIGSKCRTGGTTNTGGNVVIGYRATGTGSSTMYNGTHVGYEADPSGNGGITLGYRGVAGSGGLSIGFEAGVTLVGGGCITLNAQDIALNGAADALFVKPIRDASSANALYYDTSTYEITYGADHSGPVTGEEWWKYDGAGPSLFNFYGPSGNVMGTGTLSGNRAVICGYDISGNAGGDEATAVGREAGLFEKAVAIGYRALSATNATWAGANEGKGTVALGARAGETTSASELSNYNTFVGYEAGYASSGMYGGFNVALGYKASCGATFDASNTIVINATGENLVPQDSSRCYIKPIRNDASYNSIQSLHYDPTSGEITYDLDYIPSATAAEGRADALVTQLDPSQNPFLDSSGSKGLLWINQVQDASGWGAAADLPVDCAYFKGVAIGGKIYIPGGARVPTTATDWRRRELYIYDPVDNSWLEITNSLPAPSVPQWTCYYAIATLGGKMYMIGGGSREEATIHSKAYNGMRCYDPLTNTWDDSSSGSLPVLPAPYPSDITGGVVNFAAAWANKSRASNPTDGQDGQGTSNAAAASLGGKIYVTGGSAGPQGSSDRTSKGAWSYDPIDNRWTSVASMNTHRTNHALVACAGKLYAIGGDLAARYNPPTPTNTVEVYDPLDPSGGWQFIAPLDASRGSTFGAAAVGGKIYVWGGAESYSGLTPVNPPTEVYDTQNPSGGWHTRGVTWPYTGSNERAFAANVAMGGILYAIGGDKDAGGILFPPETTRDTKISDLSLNPQLQVTYQGEDFYVSAQRGGPKTFIIQHPEDPDRLLRHACIEAPTRGTNLYEYQIQTATDNATTEIALPSYFSKLNGRARVYVFAADTLSMCYGKVNEELTEAIIHTQKAGTFNVIVTGIRKDPAALEFSSTEMIDF